MKLRPIIEATILGLFLIAALIVILWSNTAVPGDTGSNKSAMEHIKAGDLLYEAGSIKFSAAAVEYWEAIKQDPNSAKARFRIASIHYHYGWNYEPLRELDEVERIDPEYPGLHLLRGKIQHRMGNIDEELLSLQQAVLVQPENTEAHYYLGTVYQQKRRTEEAIGEYEKAIAAGSSTSEKILEAHLQLGRIYKVEEKLAAAEAEFRKALKIDTTSAEVISELRMLYGRQAEYFKNQRDYDSAAIVYRKILETDPENPRNVEVYWELGEQYFFDELYGKAKEMYEKAAKLDPMNIDVYSRLMMLESMENMDNTEGND